MKKWFAIAIWISCAQALWAGENTAVHNIGIHVYNSPTATGCVKISVISFVSWRLLESDDLIHWREKTRRILKSGQYDIYDVTQVGLASVQQRRFWRVEELPAENIVLPPQLR